MGRVLPGRFCFAACCCALALLLTLASRDASQAQQRYQARIDLKLEIRIKEAWWEGRSAVPTRVIPFCVRNVGTMSSGAATLRVDRILVGGFTVAEFAIHPLAPNEEKCDRVRITARPDWHGTTQYFAGDLKVNDDADLSSNYVRFPVAFPSDQKVDLDLRVGSPHLDPGGLLIVPFVVTNYGT